MLMLNANAKKVVKKGVSNVRKISFRCCFSIMISKSLYDILATKFLSKDLKHANKVLR
jgi:hypothetical protein